MEKMTDLEATLEIDNILCSFNLEILKAITRTNPPFLDVIESYCSKIQALREEYLDWYLPYMYRFARKADYGLFSDIKEILTKIKKRDHSTLLQTPLQVARGELPGISLINDILNDLIDIFHEAYRWYWHLLQRYEVEMSKTASIHPRDDY